MLRLCLLAAALACDAAASDVKQAGIHFVGNTYLYQFTIEVQAPLQAVREVITDYDNLDRVNDEIIQSEVLERYDRHRLRRRIWLKHCLLVFCFDLYFVEDVEDLDDGLITATIVPARSNFRRGYSNWRIEAVSAVTTRISVEAEQEPEFWIPPVIGPFIVKRSFMQEVRETGINIEREATHAEAE
jgi:hypothetical protein